MRHALRRAPQLRSLQICREERFRPPHGVLCRAAVGWDRLFRFFRVVEIVLGSGVDYFFEAGAFGELLASLRRDFLVG